MSQRRSEATKQDSFYELKQGGERKQARCANSCLKCWDTSQVAKGTVKKTSCILEVFIVF